jgi:DNA-binding transcriptional ArsR family regulator
MISPTIAQEVSMLHADLCAALADPTRLILLYTLSYKPFTVTELTQELNLSQPMVSRHLKILRAKGLVTATRLGTVVQYELADQRIITVLDMLRTILRERIQHNVDLLIKID